MTLKEHLTAKINILLKAINQYKDKESASKLLEIVERELNTMLVILNNEII